MSLLPVKRAAEITESPPQRWLVESLWTQQAVGDLCAQPKSGKSWLALDFAVSVASGTPVLDRFAVADHDVRPAGDALTRDPRLQFDSGLIECLSRDALDLCLIGDGELRSGVSTRRSSANRTPFVIRAPRGCPFSPDIGFEAARAVNRLRSACSHDGRSQHRNQADISNTHRASQTRWFSGPQCKPRAPDLVAFIVSCGHQIGKTLSRSPPGRAFRTRRIAMIGHSDNVARFSYHWPGAPPGGAQ